MLGFVLGGIVGSRLKKKMNFSKMNEDQKTIFKVNGIIKWTKKNQKKIDQLWMALIIERVTEITHLLDPH